MSTPSSSPESEATRPAGGQAQAGHAAGRGPFTDTAFSERERKSLFLYVVVAIVLLEMAVTVGAIVYSIANAERSAPGVMRFNFPWIGYLVTVTLVPVLVMLILHLVSLGMNRSLRDAGGGQEHAPVEGRAATFFALVRGAPTVILFAAFVLMGAAVYYLDGVMALLLKLGDSFAEVAIWVVGALALASCVSIVARAVFAYKSKQMEAEYAFRREVLEKTGTILLDARYAPTTDLRQLPSVVDVQALTEDAGRAEPASAPGAGADSGTEVLEGKAVIDGETGPAARQ
ncbi:MAG TPA: hypothetical protein IAB01_04810 [Candidatus Avidesulfovibrio excrementigallinarum]|nr:hypothetical protein [Candidatus Avidesulfovibrio excrementigallinarum]